VSPEQVVRAFCEAWSRRDVDEILGYFTDDAVYHNIPVDPAQGKDAIRATLELFVPPSTEISFEVLKLAADGPIVHTERVDRFVINGNTVEIPVAGVFEISGDKIAAWRDYFDMQQFMSQVSGTG
jgi:limonene-1,2-epoxide hydrolase